MKYHRYLLGIALLMAGSLPTFSQVSADNYDVVKLDTISYREYRPGQVLVKFKDGSSLKIRKRGSGRVAADQQNVQSLLDKFGIEGMEQLMPKGGSVKMQASARLRSVTGKQLEDRAY